MDGVIAPLGTPGQRQTKSNQADFRGRAAPADAGAETSRKDSTARTQFRMDEAYRVYRDSVNMRATKQADTPRAGLRKISSAELLATMIHQMGGGARSYTKGMFVNVAV